MASPTPEPGQNGSGHPHLNDRELSGRLMRHQAMLGLRVAAVFLVLILGLPLLTQFAPSFTQQTVLGFPLSWFILGLAFYPITWALSAYFVKASEKLEHDEAQMVREERGLRRVQLGQPGVAHAERADFAEQRDQRLVIFLESGNEGSLGHIGDTSAIIPYRQFPADPSVLHNPPGNPDRQSIDEPR